MGVTSSFPLDSGNTGRHPEGTGGYLLLEKEEDLQILGGRKRAYLVPLSSLLKQNKGPGINSDSVWTWACAGLSALSFLPQGYRG